MLFTLWTEVSLESFARFFLPLFLLSLQNWVLGVLWRKVMISEHDDPIGHDLLSIFPLQRGKGLQLTWCNDTRTWHPTVSLSCEHVKCTTLYLLSASMTPHPHPQKATHISEVEPVCISTPCFLHSCKNASRRGLLTSSISSLLFIPTQPCIKATKAVLSVQYLRAPHVVPWLAMFHKIHWLTLIVLLYSQSGNIHPQQWVL